MITIALIVVAVLSLLLGLMVFSQQYKQLPVLCFLLANTSAAVWAVAVAIFLLSSNPAALLGSAQVFYIAATGIAYFMLLFSMTFAQQTINKLLLGVISLPLIALFIVLIFAPHVLIEHITISSGSNTVTLNMAFYSVYIIYFVIYFGAALLNLWHRSLNASPILRNHFRHIFYAYGAAGTMGTFFNLFLPAFGNYQLIWIGPLCLVLFVPIVFLAIARYGLFDIRQTVVRTVAYVFSLLVLAAIYYLFAYLVSTLFLRSEVSSAVSISPVNILLALALAFIFQPIKNFFDKVTNDIFYRDRYDSEDFFARLNEVLSTTTDLRGLLQRAATVIGSTLKSEQAFFYVQYNHVHHVSSGTEHHSTIPVHDAHRLNEYVAQAGSDVIVTELLSEKHEIHRLLVSHKVAVLMPLMNKDRVLGYLALGEQRGSGYTNRDIKVLATISDELVIAIQNALSVQEVKDINTHLQQRIDAATKELRTSNAQLRHLDTTKDEFLSMASHQLRTPLTSVKGYISMVLEGDAGKITDMQKHLLSEAFVSSERMVHLIHDFLNVSRLQTGKFMLEARPINLVKLVDAEVKSLVRTAEARGMKLKFTHKGDIPLLNIDENKIQQVVMNYIDNAIFYSHENTTITVTLQRLEDIVELRVHDTGIGVPKHEQAQLFTKFYRASNARKQRPDGTGVGIYLAKKVITAHGGDVLFESEEGKGSTFGFVLPIDKLAVEPLTNKPDDTADN